MKVVQMKKKILALMVIAIGVFVFGAISVSAATYGHLTYSVANGEVTITDCNTSQIPRDGEYWRSGGTLPAWT